MASHLSLEYCGTQRNWWSTQWLWSFQVLWLQNKPKSSPVILLDKWTRGHFANMLLNADDIMHWGWTIRFFCIFPCGQFTGQILFRSSFLLVMLPNKSHLFQLCGQELLHTQWGLLGLRCYAWAFCISLRIVRPWGKHAGTSTSAKIGNCGECFILVNSLSCRTLTSKLLVNGFITVSRLMFSNNLWVHYLCLSLLALSQHTPECSEQQTATTPAFIHLLMEVS